MSAAPVDVLAILRWQAQLIQELHEKSGEDHALDAEDAWIAVDVVSNLIRSARSVCATGDDATLRMAITQLDKSLARCTGGI